MERTYNFRSFWTMSATKSPKAAEDRQNKEKIKRPSWVYFAIQTQLAFFPSSQKSSLILFIAKSLRYIITWNASHQKTMQRNEAHNVMQKCTISKHISFLLDKSWFFHCCVILVLLAWPATFWGRWKKNIFSPEAAPVREWRKNQTFRKTRCF